MSLQNLTEGFLLGLATGHICFATCGPVYSPYLMMRQHSWTKSIVSILEISLGRFISSVAFGAVVGMLGKKITSINRTCFTITAYILFSAFLIISAIRSQSREKGCALSRWNRFVDRPLLLGLVTGISFCPAFLIALTRAVELSGPVSGALLFTGFFAGTNIYLLPLALFGVIGNKRVMRKIAVASAVIVGSWFIMQAVSKIIILYHDETHLSAELGNSIVNLLDDRNMYILSDDTARFSEIQKTFNENRTGDVSFIEGSDPLPDSGYVLIDPVWPQKSGTPITTLKNKNRFVIILPYPGRFNAYNELYAEELISFFSTRYFKRDTVSGSSFDMSSFYDQ